MRWYREAAPVCSVGTGGGAQLSWDTTRKDWSQAGCVPLPVCWLRWQQPATVLLLVTRSVTGAAILDVDLGSHIAATYTEAAQG